MITSPANALHNECSHFQEPEESRKEGHRCFLTALDLTYVSYSEIPTGKTSLVKAVVSSEQVQKAFNGGIIWISAAGSGSHVAPLQLETMLTCNNTTLWLATLHLARSWLP